MNGEDKGYVLSNAKGKGEGVFATRDFRKNELVMKGEVVRIVEENTKWTTQVGKNQFILRGGLATKVNHSCSPNVGYRDNQEGGLDYIAFKDITSGEEIVGDYAMGNYKIDHMPKCLCGSASCRGTITGWKDLPADIKERYRNFSALYLWELDSNDG